MSWWQAIVLGAVQGFAEFLPVSSSGHLILIQKWFGITENAFFYSIMLHIGTLIPVIVVLYRQIINVFKRPFTKLGFWVLASIPAGIVGLLTHFIVGDLDAFFVENLWLLGITFLLTAGELIYSEYRCKKIEMINPINIKTSLTMGIGQALSVFPGLSRSGTTMSAGCFANVKREENASFTFLMSIPVILAAVFLESIDVVKNGVGSIEVFPLLLGVFTAMICGYIAINCMLSIIKKANYKWFSVYLILISIATFITYFAM